MKQEKKVLVTGGAGFIGSHIVDSLISQGYNVTIFDNLSSGKKEFIPKNVPLIIGDITHANEINKAIETNKPDIVIHLAAQVMLRRSIEEPVHDATTNIIGTINVLEACKNNNVQKLIYTSTGGARVGEPEYLPVDENHPIKPCSPYGISKHTAEHYVWMYNKLYDLDYLIFCFGNVYGPRDNPGCKRVTAIFSKLIAENKEPIIFGDGSQTRDFIYVKDLADFIVASIEKNPKTKLFHLANGSQISVNEIFTLLKKIANKPIHAKHEKAIKGEVKDIVLDTKRAKEELGWVPSTSFEEGLRQTYEWISKNCTNNTSK